MAVRPVVLNLNVHSVQSTVPYRLLPSSPPRVGRVEVRSPAGRGTGAAGTPRTHPRPLKLCRVTSFPLAVRLLDPPVMPQVLLPPPISSSRASRCWDGVGRGSVFAFQKGQRREAGRLRVVHLRPERAAVSTRPQDIPCWPSLGPVPGLQAPCGPRPLQNALDRF